MINQLTVLNTIQDNSADVFVDNFGNLNITGLDAIPASAVYSVERIASTAGQAAKAQLTFTAANSTTYSFVINGYNMTSGNTQSQLVTYTSDASATQNEITAAVTAYINSLAGFSVTATDSGSGVVLLQGKTPTQACPFAGVFTVGEEDANIAVAAPLTVSFTAAPTGGRTATGVVVVANAGTVSSIYITDPGQGYITAPTVTFAGGGGSSAAGTAIIFEGEVVGVTISNAGSGYVNRVGIAPAGTVAALQAKYGYVANTNNSPSAPQYPALANLTSGATYTEYIISANIVTPSGATTFAQTTSTTQYSVLVNESATNVALVNSPAFGSLTNLRKGFRTSIADSGASNTAAITAATGAVAYTAGGSPAFGAVSLRILPNDIIVVGTGVIPSATGGGAAINVSSTSNTAGLIQFGGNNVATDVSAAVYKVVRRQAISK